ncbi:19284_t:CDS:10, partial [Gigaspora rosea]
SYYLEPNMIKALQFLHLKIQNASVSNEIYTKVLKIFDCSNSSLYLAKKKLSSIINLKYTCIDICINSCHAFVDDMIGKTVCTICGENRYDSLGKPRKSAFYFPLIPRLKMQYADPIRAKELKYRANYIPNSQKISDIYDGKLYKELIEEGLLSDERDILLTASCDGFQLFKQKRDDCWVLMMINNNLSPEIRVKRKNLLVTAVIPGPNQPKNFNSFLRPVINELKLLEEGILCFDGDSKQDGDIPAITKLMCITGHNSYMGCRMCDLKGIRDLTNNHIYYPLKPPRDYHKSPSYNIRNLPLRNHNKYDKLSQEWQNLQTDAAKKKFAQDTGICGRSILFELKATKFPRSFPIDIMHLLFEGVTPWMYNTGSNFEKKMEKKKECHQNLEDLQMILLGWAAYVLSAKLCVQRIITIEELECIEEYFFEFWNHYERYYGKFEKTDCGPCWTFWQFPMERLCGILQTLVQSRIFPYDNLANNILILDQFNHLYFISSLREQVFPQEISPIYSNNQVFALPNSSEEFWFPSCQYKLVDIPGGDRPLTNLCTKFARLKTFDGYMIGSVLTNTNENRRDNSCVKILVNQFNKQAALEIHYGRVLFYFVHEYFGQKNMLAYVEHANDVKHEKPDEFSKDY